MILAIYDSLRRGGSENGFLKGSKYLGESTIPGRLYALGDFPGGKFSESGQIVVDLYDVPDELIPKIDRVTGFFEDSPDQSLYQRKPITAESGLTAYAYEYKFPCRSGYLPTGDWFDEPF